MRPAVPLYSSWIVTSKPETADSVAVSVAEPFVSGIGLPVRLNVTDGDGSSSVMVAVTVVVTVAMLVAVTVAVAVAVMVAVMVVVMVAVFPCLPE